MLKRIKYTLLTLFVFSLHTNSLAETFTINGDTVIVPNPADYVTADDSMPNVQRIVQSMADPMNDTLAYYVSEQDAEIARSSKMPDLEHTFMLKLNKQLKGKIVGIREFAMLTKEIKNQNQQIFEKIQDLIPDIMDQTSKNMSNEFDSKMALSVGQMVPLDPHLEDENAFAYSMMINYGVETEGSSEELIVAATATILNVSGHLLFLYSYGPEEELEWTRKSSKEWASDVLSQNAPAQQRSPGAQTINWDTVIKKGIIGAIIGGIFGLYAMFASKKK